jgi:transposase
MRNIKEILRLRHNGLSHRQIAGSCQMAQSTVCTYLQRAERADISWPLPEDLTEEMLVAKLFPRESVAPPAPVKRPEPDFAHIHAELRAHQKVNLTLDLLWREYKEQYPEGYCYSQYCARYRDWRSKLDKPMRQSHKAGEKLFVDYGDGLAITDPSTGLSVSTQLFVAVWGLSNFTFAEATLSQKLSDWISSHVRAFTYFGCVPHLLVPDNLKSGVTSACYYEPDINPTYADLASHYGVAVLPARPRHPRDKAKVEAGVLIAKRWILAVLRHQTFYSLAEMNTAIRGLLDQLNARLLRKMEKSRRQLFDELDRPAALALSLDPYQFAEWAKATVNIDYHFEFDKHYYSVPYQHVHQKIEARFTPTTVEVFLKGQRIAAHSRSYAQHRHTTLPDHMPAAHQQQGRWNPERLLQWAETVGPCTVQFLKEIMIHRDHPEQGFRSCLGVMRLSKAYSKERMEAAALRAIRFKAFSFRSIKSILVRGLDQSDGAASSGKRSVRHDNIRGAHYYH